MFVGITLNEFPLSTSEEMTETYSGTDLEYVIFIEQSINKEIFIEQSEHIDVYIKQELDLTLEN
jgi:hypothetical protein